MRCQGRSKISYLYGNSLQRNEVSQAVRQSDEEYMAPRVPYYRGHQSSLLTTRIKRMDAAHVIPDLLEYLTKKIDENNSMAKYNRTQILTFTL